MQFYTLTLGIIVALFASACSSTTEPYFITRGVVLTVDDLDDIDWPQRAKEAGLTTIATHVTPSQVAAFIQSEEGQAFLEECGKLGLEVEHELHAMKDLLPRELFEEDSTMFRMNEEGRRVADYNLCVHSEKALRTVGENAVKYARILTPTTHRYFYWIDDGHPMCRCPECRNYSDSEQALILENSMLRALKEFDPEAKLAHLAYFNTIQPPVKVKPEPGIFLEFAPITRSWEQSLLQPQALGRDSVTTHAFVLEMLDKNLEVFGSEDAQVLEYWLDVSLFSNWTKPAVQLPWNENVFKEDMDVYAKRGIRHITSFAVYIDEEYLEQYKDLSFIREYGNALKDYELQE